MSARCVVRSLVVVVLATAATTVLAQPAEKKPPRKIERKPAVPDKPGASDPAPVPKPASELAELKYFLGTWHCEGNAPASPMGPAHRSRATVVTRVDLDGFWYSGTVREEKAAGARTGGGHPGHQGSRERERRREVPGLGRGERERWGCRRHAVVPGSLGRLDPRASDSQVRANVPRPRIDAVGREQERHRRTEVAARQRLGSSVIERGRVHVVLGSGVAGVGLGEGSHRSPGRCQRECQCQGEPETWAHAAHSESSRRYRSSRSRTARMACLASETRVSGGA